MKRKLDLRTGRPVWFAYRAPRVAAGPLTRDLACDVAVIGLGISGAMILEALSAQGLSVVGIDRRGVMRGSTPATTALVQYEIDQPLTKLAPMIGRAAAEQAWRRSRLAVVNLANHIARLAIPCNAAARPSVYLAGNVLSPGELRTEVLARRATGLDARYLTAMRLEEEFGIARKGAIVSEGNLALDPRKLTAGLLAQAAAGGARLHAPVEATALESDAAGVTIATGGGPTIRAGHVVAATGYELLGGVPAKGHRIISTWAIATAPQPRAIWPRQAFIWEASDPYLYMRATADGRVICGGEDEDFSDEDARDALIGRKTDRIARKLAALMPGIDTTPSHRWTGSFGATGTGLPIIAPVPRKPRIVAVMGYGGNGITYSRIAAELVTTLMAGRDDSDAGLYAFR